MSNLKLKISQRSRWLFRGTYIQTDYLLLSLPQTYLFFFSENRWIKSSTWLSHAASDSIQASITGHTTGTALHRRHTSSHSLVAELAHSSTASIAATHAAAARTSISTHGRRH